MIKISGLQKLSLLDYPGCVSAIIFTQGCNYKCKFCQNSEFINTSCGTISTSEVFDYLQKRQKVLDGVVISGGEPCMQKNLKSFIEQIKKMNLKVKLDTNGTNPEMLKELIENNLIDYIAMDIKTIFEEYEKIVCSNALIDNIQKSIKLIQNSNIEHEFRTTIMKEYHSIDTLKKICKEIGAKEKYYIQNFQNSENVIDQSLTPFTEDELIKIQKELNKNFPNVKVRGI